MNRLLLLSIVLCFSSTIDAATPAKSFADPDFRGVWFNENPQARLTQVDGSPPPLTEAGKALHATNMEALEQAKGKPVERNDVSRCVPYGPTRILQQPFPFQIIQRADTFVMLFEHNHVFQPVYLNEKAGTDPSNDWTYNGYAVGRWVKGGLNIELSRFNDLTFLDDTGLPHSDQLAVTQRLERSRDGTSLTITSTITDTTLYSKSWSTRQVFTLKPDMRIEEFVCGQATYETRYTRGQAAPSNSGGQSSAASQ